MKTTDIYLPENWNYDYVQFVEKAAINYKDFLNFKINPSYNYILEHVTKELGQSYLDIIKQEFPKLIDNYDIIKKNDIVGNPNVYEYNNIGTTSPTTIRYAKVASDLKKYFGKNIGEKVCEIGVGYGGQCLVLDTVFDIDEYYLLDMNPVLKLVERYLECFLLKAKYECRTLNQTTKHGEWDLCISNYAFSELPIDMQLKYIEKILFKSKKGYLTMNSGNEINNPHYNTNHLNVSQLQKLLPPFSIIEEIPLTRQGNYIIIWGN